MTKILADIDMSLDGFVVGDRPSPENPLGKNGERLIWYGDDVNDPDAELETSYGKVDAQVLKESGLNEGAVIMGRTTFDVSIGAWGENPPIHKPCFILTHNHQEKIEKPGGTSFTFITEGLDEAVRQARAAANDQNISVIGGAKTIQQFLNRGLLDELRIHLVPTLLGTGIRLFTEEMAANLRFPKSRVVAGELATHIYLRPEIEPDSGLR